MDRLERELKLQLLKPLGQAFRRISAGFVSREWLDLCRELLVVHGHVTAGWLPIAEGKAFSAILDLGRFSALDFASVPGVRTLGDVCNMRAQASHTTAFAYVSPVFFGTWH